MFKAVLRHVVVYVTAISFYLPSIVPFAPIAELSEAQAKVVCGGMDLNGNWIGDCDYKKAAFVGKPESLKCPAGSFFDLKGKLFSFMNTAECWSCPDGYRRAGNHVESKNACFIRKHEDWKPAKFVTKYRCKFGGPASAFWDGYDGGACWSCPPNTKRSALHVAGQKACFDSKNWYSAKRVGPKCPEGTVADPRNGGECWACPGGYKRRGVAVTDKNACFKVVPKQTSPATMVKKVGCPKNSFFDPIDGGSCWSCPAYYYRAPTNVKGDKACVSSGFEWQTSPYREPGWFEFSSFAKQAHQIAKDPKAVYDFLSTVLMVTEFGGKNPGGTALHASIKVAWKAMIEDPRTSPAFNAMMFAVLQKAIENPDTPNKKALVKDFSNYIVKRRTFIAQDLINAYDAWKLSDDYRKGRAKNTASLYDLGTKPPNFKELAEKQMQVSAGKAAAALTMTTLTGIGMGFTAASAAGYAPSIPMFAFVSPYGGLGTSAQVGTSKLSATAFKHAFKVGGKTIFTVLGKGSTLGASKVASLVSAASGPIMIVTTAATLAIIAGKHVFEVKNARPNLVKGLEAAKKPIDLKTLRDMGGEQHAYYWALMTSSPGIQNPARLQESLKASLDKRFGSYQWAQVPGNAHDVAVAENGTAWIVGLTNEVDGNTIYKRGAKENRWTKVRGPETPVVIGGRKASAPGGATRIAMNGNRVFITNTKGEVFMHNGNTWESQGKPGAKEHGAKTLGAVDIGASQAAVYAVGGKNHSGNYEIYQWKGKNNWRKTTGGAVRIDVDAKGVPWIVQKSGHIHAMTRPNNWQQFNGQGTDIAVHKPGVPVVVDMHGVLHAFNGNNNQWNNLNRKSSAVAVSPHEKVWYLDDKELIFRQN